MSTFGVNMDRDKQLPLNFGPPQEPAAVVALGQHSVGPQLPNVARIADILHLPSAAERERKKVSEREAELLERVLRRAWQF